MNSTTESSNKPQMQDEPIPPFPPQHQDSVGLESRLEPRPRFEAVVTKPPASWRARWR